MLAHRLIPLCLLPSSNRNLYSSRCLLARHCFFSHLLSASEHSLNLREAARHPVSTDLNVDTTVSGQLLLLLFFSVCPCMCMCVCVSLPFLCLCLSVRLSPFSVSVSLPLALPLSLLSSAFFYTHALTCQSKVVAEASAAHDRDMRAATTKWWQRIHTLDDVCDVLDT